MPTISAEAFRRLFASWGVEPVLILLPSSFDENELVRKVARESGYHRDPGIPEHAWLPTRMVFDRVTSLRLERCIREMPSVHQDTYAAVADLVQSNPERFVVLSADCRGLFDAMLPRVPKIELGRAAEVGEALRRGGCIINMCGSVPSYQYNFAQELSGELASQIEAQVRPNTHVLILEMPGSRWVNLLRAVERSGRAKEICWLPHQSTVVSLYREAHHLNVQAPDGAAALIASLSAPPSASPGALEPQLGPGGYGPGVDGPRPPGENTADEGLGWWRVRLHALRRAEAERREAVAEELLARHGVSPMATLLGAVTGAILTAIRPAEVGVRELHDVVRSRRERALPLVLGVFEHEVGVPEDDAPPSPLPPPPPELDPAEDIPLTSEEKARDWGGCPVCGENRVAVVTPKCGHMACRGCYHTWVETCKNAGRAPSCPVCREASDEWRLLYFS